MIAGYLSLCIRLARMPILWALACNGKRGGRDSCSSLGLPPSEPSSLPFFFFLLIGTLPIQH